MRFAIFKAGRSTERGRRDLGDVHGMFMSLLAQPEDDWEVFEVREGMFPERLEVFDGIVITGSPKSVYEDIPWVHQLLDVTREAYKAGVPLLGVCFGHQVVAQALGGEVIKNPKGWDLGINQLELTAEGRRIPGLAQAPQPLRVLELHQDMVSRLPPGAQRLATSKTTENEMFRIGNQVLCIQGHPEMDNEEVRDIITSRDYIPQASVEKGLLTLHEQAHREFFQSLMVGFLQNQSLEKQPAVSLATG